MKPLWKAFKEQIDNMANIRFFWNVSVCFVNWIHYQSLVYLERYYYA